MAGYSGKKIELDEALNSTKLFSREVTSLQDEPPVLPDDSGAYPLPVPGRYEAV
jgi:hypothetical protein